MIEARRIRFVALDSWRGLCALLVAVHNVGCSGSPFFTHASLFVDFFFVLSGFVITHAYMTKLETRFDVYSFMLRRFGRLWPLHFTILMTFVGIEVVKLALASRIQMLTPPFSDSNSTAAAILPNLLLLQSFFIHGHPTWNLPSWSISTEFWTYLGFATICVYWSARPPVILMISIALAAASLIIWFLPNLETNSDYALARCIYGFVVGHLVYRAWERGPSRVTAPTLLEISALLAIVVFVFVEGEDLWSMIAPIVFGLAVWIFAYENGWASKILHLKPFVRLGLWSYSIYMVHWLVLSLMSRSGNFLTSLIDGRPSFEMFRTTICGGTWMTSAVLAGYLAIVIAIASLTYRFIECPARVYFNGLADKLAVRHPTLAND